MSRNFGDPPSKRRKPRIDAAVAGDIGTVERQVAAIRNGEYVGAVANAHDDVELQVFAPREFSWTSQARGRAALKAALKHNVGTVEDRRRRVANVLSQGDAVVLFGREQGRIRQTGEAYDIDFVHRLTFRDGRLASVRIIAARSARGHRSRVLPYGGTQSRKTA